MGSKHGRGRTTQADGNTYDGEWKDNLKDGRGTHIRPDKSKYEGQWFQNAKHGRGVLPPARLPRCNAEPLSACLWAQVYSFANGDRYDGEVRHGVRHGMGTFTSANGAKYVGEFAGGKMHGRGTYTSPPPSAY